MLQQWRRLSPLLGGCAHITRRTAKPKPSPSKSPQRFGRVNVLLGEPMGGPCLPASNLSTRPLHPTHTATAAMPLNSRLDGPIEGSRSSLSLVPVEMQQHRAGGLLGEIEEHLVTRVGNDHPLGPRDQSVEMPIYQVIESVCILAA
jgi:hypothetical protein